MSTIDEAIQQAADKLETRRAQLQLQHDRLLPFFMAVSDQKDWKAPINAYCRASDVSAVSDAINFFTATDAHFYPIDGNPDWVKVVALGYRAGPAGDH